MKGRDQTVEIKHSAAGISVRHYQLHISLQFAAITVLQQLLGKCYSDDPSLIIASSNSKEAGVL